MFEVNADGHVFGAPHDAFFKSGAGGSAIFVVPSLDLAIYKMSGNDAQFNPELTGLPATYQSIIRATTGSPVRTISFMTDR